MEFNYAYRRTSAVESSASATSMSFSPDLKREPTFFRGNLTGKLPFREAISALHSVVTSDLRWHPKDKSEYKAWRAQQDDVDLAEIAGTRAELRKRSAELRQELDTLYRESQAIRRPFLDAQQRYFDYLYKKDYDAWFVLDPVITVHPDQVFFECFSQDESSYGRLSVGRGAFSEVAESSCGTTNIDYSQALYNEFQKIRSYKDTLFEIDPTGFQVETQHEDTYKEQKIDLPDSWVRGFLQVSSAMTLDAMVVELHPMDIYNLCLYLRRHKELKGPRSLRFKLKAGEPVSVIVDPWNHEIRCPRSRYLGSEDAEIRCWGRRRLHILERLIPIANSFRLHLLGSGMPYFFVAELNPGGGGAFPMSFTLGLSGWTANDWSNSGNFDLMAPRQDVDSMTQERVFDALKENWAESPDSLAQRLGLERGVVLGALGAYTQAGRAIYDLVGGLYRVRELSGDPLPMETLRFSNPREEEAASLLAAGKIRLRVSEGPDGVVRIRAKMPDRPELLLDRDQRMIKAECTCNFFQQNRLRKGPCEHILAARLAYTRRLAIVEEADFPTAEVLSAPSWSDVARENAAQEEEPREESGESGIGGWWRKLTGKSKSAGPAPTPDASDEPRPASPEEVRVLQFTAIVFSVEWLREEGIVAVDDATAAALISELKSKVTSPRDGREFAVRTRFFLNRSDVVTQLHGTGERIDEILQACYERARSHREDD